MSNNGKIISLLPSATEIVCALGLGERLVGVTHECDHPPWVEELPHLTSSKIIHGDMSSAEIDHAVRTNLDGHGSIYSLDEELLRNLDAELIITQELCEVCAVGYGTVLEAARLCAADVTVVSLEPHTIEDIFANIETVGELTGSSRAAADLTFGLRKRIAHLRKLTDNAGRRPEVMMLEWLEPPFAPGHWVPEQVEAAGGRCVLGAAGEKSETTTYSKIAESNADVLVLIPCGYSTGEILAQLENTLFPEELSGLPAFDSGEVWALDASAYFSRPGPRVIDGAEILAKIFHPDLCGQATTDEAVRVDTGLFNFKAQGTKNLNIFI